MKFKTKARNGFIHLYNPKKEGLGSYDINYRNAYKRKKTISDKIQIKSFKRYAAWFHY